MAYSSLTIPLLWASSVLETPSHLQQVGCVLSNVVLTKCQTANNDGNASQDHLKLATHMQTDTESTHGSPEIMFYLHLDQKRA
jgi:hypothetical protein